MSEPTASVLPLPQPDAVDTIAEALDDATEVADTLDYEEQTIIDDETLSLIDEAKTNLRTILEVVHGLRANDYRLDVAEQFGDLQVAIAKATVLLTRNDVLPEEIMSVMDEIKTATTGLKGLEPTPAPAKTTSTIVSEQTQEIVTPAVDWSALQMAVSEIAKLTPDNYTASSYAVILNELENAKTILARGSATQADANLVVNNLYQAYISLVPVQNYNSTLAVNSTINQVAGIDDVTVEPNLLMSMMAGAYAGLATYRKSRLEAKRRKTLARQAQV